MSILHRRGAVMERCSGQGKSYADGSALRVGPRTEKGETVKPERAPKSAAGRGKGSKKKKKKSKRASKKAKAETTLATPFPL